MVIKRRSIVLLIFVLLLNLVLATTVSAENLYSKTAEATYKITTYFKVVNSGKYSAFDATVNIHIGADSSSYYQTSLGYNITPSANSTKRDNAGNIFAEIVIKELKPGEEKTIKVDKYISNSGIEFSENIYNIKAEYTEFLSNPLGSQYLSHADKIEKDAKDIKLKANEFNMNKPTLEVVRDIYDFVNLYIEYDDSSIYANKGALSAIRTGKGVCDEYASLFVALCRASNIPSRLVSGYWITEALPLDKEKDISREKHAWAEFYIPNVGWIPAEPTFRYIYNGIKTPNYNYFANIGDGDSHIITGYKGNKDINEIQVSYYYYNKTSLNISIGEEKITPMKYYDNNSFTDIYSSWAKSEVQKLYNKGIVFAKENDEYKPSLNITRGEFSAFLVNALGLQYDTIKEVKFKDVQEQHSLSYFIKLASAYGLIKGDGVGYFHPDKSITRQDAAVIMERSLKLINSDKYSSTELDFVDKNKISSYAYSSVQLIYDMKIMNGKPGKLFDPKGYTTRAEAAKIIDNFIQRIP